MPLYRKIFKQAFLTTWNHKYLWFFGLFAALIGGSGIFDLAIRSMPGSGALESWRNLQNIGFFRWDTLRNLQMIIMNDPISMMLIFALLLVVFILFLFFVWLAIVSQNAMIYAAGQYAGGRDANFQESVDCGVRKFWPALSLNIFIKALVYIFSFLALAILTWGGFEATPASFLAMLVSVITTITISFALKYALGFLIIRKEGIFTSISLGVKLFADNFLVSVEMAFFLFIFNLLAAYLTTACVLVMSAPLLLMTKLFTDVAAGAGYWFMLAISLAVILLFIVLVGAVTTAFHIYAWTALFTELVSRGGKSKLMRLLTKEAGG